MKKINWKVFYTDSELWTIFSLLLALYELYTVTDHWIWIVALLIWLSVLHVHLAYLNRLAVGGAVKETNDE